MVSLSIIFEDKEDGTVQIKTRSTRELPTDVASATPAELVMLESTGWLATTYNIRDGGIIDFGIIKPSTPTLIVP